MTYYLDEDDDIEIEKIMALLPNRTIDVAIEMLVDHLYDLLEKLYNETDGDEILNIIGKKISSGDIDQVQIADLTFPLGKDTQKNIESGETGIRLALTYTYAAIKLEQNKSMSQAWLAISEARYHIGYCQAVYDASKRSGPNERAQKGGRGKQLKIVELNEIIIEALLKMKPKKGWESPSSAANTIVESVIASLAIKDNRYAKEPRADLIHRILTGVIDDSIIKQAYDSTPPAECNNNDNS